MKMKFFLIAFSLLMATGSQASTFSTLANATSIHRLDIGNTSDRQVEFSMTLQLGQLTKGTPVNEQSTNDYCYTVSAKNMPTHFNLNPHMGMIIYLDAAALKAAVEAEDSSDLQTLNCGVVTIVADKQIIRDAFYVYADKETYTKTAPDVFDAKIN